MTAPHFVFLAVGVVLILVAVILRLVGTATIWLSCADLVMNVGVSVLAVSVVDFLWRRLGGDPIIAAIERLHGITNLLRDLDQSGIRRVYARRDQYLGKEELLAQMRTAREVDMMGIALQHGWANDRSFLDILQQRAGAGKCHFRIAVLHPEGQVLRQREKEEAEGHGTGVGRISRDALTSLEIFDKARALLPAADRAHLELRAVRESNLYCSILRVDDRMVVTLYLASRRGSKSPTLEIREPASPFYEMYKEEFERIWRVAEEWPVSAGEAPRL